MMSGAAGCGNRETDAEKRTQTDTPGDRGPLKGADMENIEKDTFSTSEGSLEISFVGHGTLLVEFKGRTIHIDPYSGVADYSCMPEADIIFITHHHHDHLDPEALKHIVKKDTVTVCSRLCSEKTGSGIVMENGDVRDTQGIKTEAVPAYNIKQTRGNGEPFHVKGEGNGYILTFGDTRVYVAGDTENIPEMKQIKDIDIAFLPMNLPYTMTPETAADAALTIKPKILYPYHFGETDTSQLVTLLKDSPEIEVRIRDLQ